MFLAPKQQNYQSDHLHLIHSPNLQACSQFQHSFLHHYARRQWNQCRNKVLCHQVYEEFPIDIAAHVLQQKLQRQQSCFENHLPCFEHIGEMDDSDVGKAETQRINFTE